MTPFQWLETPGSLYALACRAYNPTNLGGYEDAFDTALLEGEPMWVQSDEGPRYLPTPDLVLVRSAAPVSDIARLGDAFHPIQWRVAYVRPGGVRPDSTLGLIYETVEEIKAYPQPNNPPFLLGIRLPNDGYDLQEGFARLTALTQSPHLESAAINEGSIPVEDRPYLGRVLGSELDYANFLMSGLYHTGHLVARIGDWNPPDEPRTVQDINEPPQGLERRPHLAHYVDDIVVFGHDPRFVNDTVAALPRAAFPAHPPNVPLVAALPPSGQDEDTMPKEGHYRNPIIIDSDEDTKPPARPKRRLSPPS